ncbi:hypothetical protein J6590_086645 [Homalodisca vitripennis]|nr:hypothetical protein J6590_086645 [Homalodisca vitripennis]
MSQDPTNMSVPVRNITASRRGWANLYNDGRLESSDGRTKHLKDGVFKVNEYLLEDMPVTISLSTIAVVTLITPSLIVYAERDRLL